MPYPWAEYLEAMRRLELAIKLVSYHTRECAKHTERTAIYALLTAYHVREYTKRKVSEAE